MHTMQSGELLETIERLTSPILEAQGLKLVDLDLKRRGRRSTLSFYVDKTGGAGIDDCSRVNGMIGDVLAVAGLFDEGFDLEVSSPGLDRELRKDRELTWAAGKSVRVWTRAPVEGVTELRGRLISHTVESLMLETESGMLQQIPRSVVAKIRLDFEFPKRSRA
jgi:ribosome maturation factor RimP